MDTDAFAEAVVRTATPLAFAALGESISERSGVINVGMEGVIVAGCLGAAIVGASLGAWPGVLGGIAAGALLSAVFAVFAVHLRGNQIITGAAVTVGAYGLTGTVYRGWFGDGGVALTLPTLPPLPLSPLDRLPVLGQALFAQPLLTYLLYFLVGVSAWVLFRTHVGLALRAAGEYPAAVRAAGVSVTWLRSAAVLVGGALGGLAGATLVLAQTGTFTEQMSAGRGFIAIGVVALGRWHPAGAAAGALLFGAASAFQYQLQATGAGLPYQVFLSIPYILTLIVLVVGPGRTRAPAALGTASGDGDGLSWDFSTPHTDSSIAGTRRPGPRW